MACILFLFLSICQLATTFLSDPHHNFRALVYCAFIVCFHIIKFKQRARRQLCVAGAPYAMRSNVKKLCSPGLWIVLASRTKSQINKWSALKSVLSALRGFRTPVERALSQKTKTRPPEEPSA